MVTRYRTLGTAARRDAAHGGLGLQLVDITSLHTENGNIAGSCQIANIDISLGIYEPIIKHGLQTTTTYCKKDISTQSL